MVDTVSKLITVLKRARAEYDSNPFEVGVKVIVGDIEYDIKEVSYEEGEPIHIHVGHWHDDGGHGVWIDEMVSIGPVA